MPERPIGTTTGRGIRREAHLYIANQRYQVSFTSMNVKSLALILCPAGCEIPFGFKLSFGGSSDTSSPWLYLTQCVEIDRQTRTITWRYYQPVSWTGPARDRRMAIQKAGKEQSWRLDPNSTQTAPWNSDEVLLSWDLSSEERFAGVPAEQFRQCRIVLEAINQLANQEPEDAGMATEHET